VDVIWKFFSVKGSFQICRQNLFADIYKIDFRALNAFALDNLFLYGYTKIIMWKTTVLLLAKGSLSTAR
jgi:hypothetical protein